MVFIWRGGGRRGGWGPGPGWGRGYGPGYGPGPGWGGPPPGWGYRRGYGGGGGSCLRDLLLLDAGCCLAESLGCGTNLLLVAPTTIRHIRRDSRAHRSVAARMVAAIRVYQREISPRRPPVCRFTPSCSEYAARALETHGARRGGRLAVRRLLRCRPGVAGGSDPVPEAA
jgi:hypothetical protein